MPVIANASLFLGKELEFVERGFIESMLRQVPVGISIAGAPDGRAIMTNHEALRILGGAQDGLSGIGINGHGALHEDGRPYGLDEYPTARAWRLRARTCGS